MSTTSDQKYVDLKKLCDKVDSKLFEPLSWILLLNLDLIPQEDIDVNPNLKFSADLMNGKFKEAYSIAKFYAQSDKPIASHYKDLFAIDPELKLTSEVAEIFFSLAKKRLEILKVTGFKLH